MTKDSKKSKKVDYDNLRVKDLSVKRLSARDACLKNVKIGKVEVSSISVDEVIIQGVNLNNYLVQGASATDLGFDAIQDTGVFGDRTPKKPDGINEEVWQQMLLNLKETVIPQLGNRLAKGRVRLGLPDVTNDVDLVGTISIPPFYQSFPEDESKKNMIQYYTGMGWNFEVANAAALLGKETIPPFSAVFVGSIDGDILTVTNVSYGFVSQGLILSGEGIPEGTLILDQLTRDPLDGPFFKNGTYKINTSLSLPSSEIEGVFPSGPRVCSIYIHYGYVEKETGLIQVKTYDLGNRQFEPTIDYDPEDDPECVESWGEKFNGYRPLSTTMIQTVTNNMRTETGALDPNNTGCIQLVILRETGIIAYFPGGCDDNRSITTQVTNPNCISNCTGNATSTTTVDTSVKV